MPGELLKTIKTPLYRQIAAVLRDEIRTKYAADDSLPPQRELAQRFKTSYLTVNNAIKELVDEGLVTRTARAGTFVCDRQYASRGLIGILISAQEPFYMSQMFGTIERKLREARFRPVLYGGNCDYEEELRVLNEIGRYKEAGLIFYSRFAGQLTLQIDNLIKSGIPVTTINWPFAHADCARIDHFMVGVLQARYVLEKQCRQLLYIDVKNKHFRGLPPYMDGFMATIVESGLGTNHVCIEKISTEKVGKDADKEMNVQLAQIIRRYFAESAGAVPDAVLAYGDRYLPAVVETLRSLGREPGRDVVLVGDDDQNLSAFPYATINERLEEIGNHSVRLLLDRIDGKYDGPPRIHDISPTLVEHRNE